MRWLDLMTRSSFDQAVALIMAEPSYADLTQTQYASAVEWLKATSLLIDTTHGLMLSPTALRAGTDYLGQQFFAEVLENSPPTWLLTGDELISDAADLPSEAVRLAEVAGVTSAQAAMAILRVRRKVNYKERARVGAAGERALAAILEEQWPGSVDHVALFDDSFGYDIQFSHRSRTWHLEVKSTTRRGRLTVYLSRHEHEVATLDDAWRLVTVGLDTNNRACAIATAGTVSLLSSAPVDSTSSTRWENARHRIHRDDLSPGLPFLGEDGSMRRLTLAGQDLPRFDWMPSELAVED
ncbi:protein NO VEIN domain-containing protein [Actinoplanes sp. NPDC004185]